MCAAGKPTPTGIDAELTQCTHSPLDRALFSTSSEVRALCGLHSSHGQPCPVWATLFPLRRVHCVGYTLLTEARALCVLQVFGALFAAAMLNTEALWEALA